MWVWRLTGKTGSCAYMVRRGARAGARRERAHAWHAHAGPGPHSARQRPHVPPPTAPGARGVAGHALQREERRWAPGGRSGPGGVCGRASPCDPRPTRRRLPPSAVFSFGVLLYEIFARTLMLVHGVSRQSARTDAAAQAGAGRPACASPPSATPARGAADQPAGAGAERARHARGGPGCVRPPARGLRAPHLRGPLRPSSAAPALPPSPCQGYAAHVAAGYRPPKPSSMPQVRGWGHADDTPAHAPCRGAGLDRRTASPAPPCRSRSLIWPPRAGTTTPWRGPPCPRWPGRCASCRPHSRPARPPAARWPSRSGAARRAAAAACCADAGSGRGEGRSARVCVV